MIPFVTDGQNAAGIFMLVCVLGIVCLIPFLRDLDRRAEEDRQEHDGAAFRAQLAAMTDDETRRWQEWASETPIHDDLAAERLRSELDEWGRPA